MSTEQSDQPGVETSGRPSIEIASTTASQEITPVNHDHEHDHDHDHDHPHNHEHDHDHDHDHDHSHDHEHDHPHDHEHIQQKRPWYATLSEDWLATIAGLFLVVLLVFRILHAIP